jgi:hypothetical protein
MASTESNPTSHHIGPLTQVKFRTCLGTIGERHSRVLAFDLCLARHFRYEETVEEGTLSTSTTPTDDESSASLLDAKLNAVDAAAMAVLESYELLEMILLELPLKDMLLAQRTSKTFQSLTKKSLPIRGALFLEPGQVQALAPRAILQQLNCNPLLARLLRLRFNPADVFLCASPVTGPESVTPWRLPWRLENVSWSPFSPSPHTITMKFKLNDNVNKQAKRVHAFDTNGSWRDLRLFQPACAQLRVELLTRFPRVCGSLRFERCDVTMGEIVDALSQIYNSTVASPSWTHYGHDYGTGRDVCRWRWRA